MQHGVTRQIQQKRKSKKAKKPTTGYQGGNNQKRGEPSLREGWLVRFDQSARMWIPIATTKIVMMQKYIMAWTKIAIPLVYMFPNSITLVLAGSWNSSPGDNRMNRTTATTTGPQSGPISLSLVLSLSSSVQQVRKLKGSRQLLSVREGDCYMMVWSI